jgi:uncharacterized membrane protein YfcA
MTNTFLLIVFGVIVGVFSGVMGLGGGSVMIPVMVLAFGMTQQQAHGTSLAVMIPPVALPAVIEYWRHGNVDIRVAAWTALGVLLGSFFGALVANSIPKESLKLVFGFLLIYVAGYTIFGKEHLGRSVTLAGVLVLVAALMFGATRFYDRNVPTAKPGAAVVGDSNTELPDLKSEI